MQDFPQEMERIASMLETVQSQEEELHDFRETFQRTAEGFLEAQESIRSVLEEKIQDGSATLTEALLWSQNAMAFETYQAVSHLRIKSIQILLELRMMNIYLERIATASEKDGGI